MLNDSPRDGLVYEPFAGSGVTILAAEMVERQCLAVESNPRYGDVITGEAATLDGHGSAFVEIKSASPRPWVPNELKTHASPLGAASKTRVRPSWQRVGSRPNPAFSSRCRQPSSL
jgi:hypothetical protein